jgi:hypothetical protein
MDPTPNDTNVEDVPGRVWTGTLRFWRSFRLQSYGFPFGRPCFLR